MGEFVKLKNIATITMGQSPKSETINMEFNGIPLLQGNSDIKNNKISTKKYTTALKLKTCKKNDILFTVRAGVGDIYIASQTACIGRGFCSINVNNHLENSNKYIFYYLQKYKPQWKQISQGTTFDSINSQHINNLLIPIKIIKEQEKISDYFSNLDTVINNKQRQLELMGKYKEDLLDKIFNQKIIFKDENGCDYPKWKTAKVKEIFNITRGNVISKILLDLTNNKNNFPVYSSQTKKEGIMGYYDKFLFQDSIIWTTDGANAGTTRYVDGKFYCSNVCGVLLRNTETPNTLFAELINTKTKRHITASVIPKFMNHAMAGLEITYPTSIEEQFKISKYISNLNLLINNLKLNIKNMQKLKLDMLEKMF